MTTTRLLSGLFLVITGLLAHSCKSLAPNSELEHNANEPTRGTEAWHWLEVTEQEYYDVIADYLKLPPKDHFISLSTNANNPEKELPIRMQYWLTNIHRMLKKKFPDQLKNVPTPKAIVVKNSEANAFVSPVPVCLDIPVRLNPEIPVTKANTIDRISFTTDGEFTDDSAAGNHPICVHRKFPSALLQDLVKWFDAKSDGCSVRYDVDPNSHIEGFIVSKNCPLDPELEDVAIARSIVVVTTSNWVTINTGLIQQMKDAEWMILPTILHELGHFYRSHLTVFPKEYNYFYQINPKPAPHKPAPDVNLKDFGMKVYEHAKVLKQKAVDQQIYHSSLYKPITALIHRFCKRNSNACNRNLSCKELNRMIADGSLTNDFGNFPDEDLPEGKETSYKRYEQLASSCSQSIKLTNNRAADTLSYSDVNVMLKRADLSTVLPIPSGKTNLQALITALQSQMPQAIENAEALIKSAEERKIIRYTIEMEADEFGIEQFAQLGLEPRDWLDADFVFNNAPDEEEVKPIYNSSGGNYRGNVDNKTCEKAYRNGWKFSGRPFIPDRGGFYDPHPNNCFRTFDMSQEITAHRYVKRPVTLPTPPGKPWADLVKLAESASNADNNSESDTAHARAILAPHFRGCPMLQSARRYSH